MALSIDKLDRRLRSRLAKFFSKPEVEHMPEEIRSQRYRALTVFDRLKDNHIESYFFGGFLRDLLTKDRGFMPRDFDVVVGRCPPGDLDKLFEDFPHRRTRFGGLRIIDGELTIDIWKLEDTWAFRHLSCSPSFAALPRTTFLNVEAVTAELCAEHRKRRKIVSSGFFEAIEQQILEINLEMNPFPALCVVRALSIATELNFALSRQLAVYIVDHSFPITELLDAQLNHYGCIRYDGERLQSWVKSIAIQLERGDDRIHLLGQGTLWPEVVQSGYADQSENVMGW